MYRRDAKECRAGPSHQEDPIVIVDSDCEETSNNIILLSEQIFAQERLSLTRHTQFPEVITLDSDGDEVCPITDQPSTSTSSAPRKISLKWTIPRGRLGERMSKRPKVIAYNEKKIRYEAFCEFIENNHKCPNSRQMYIHPIIHDVEYVKRRICSVFFSALEKNRKSFKRELDLSTFIFNPSYYPRDTIHGSIKRLRFTPDIRAVEATLPIFCDMPMTSSDVIFTNVTSFNHESRNYMSPDLVGAKEAKKIVACCSCTYKCELPTCECLRLQHAICGSEIQNKGYGIIEDHHDFVEFSSSEPSRKQMDNYSTVLITCGDLCACSRIEPCDNHISKLNRGHRFEYFRTDKKKGFGLRTLNPIQMDQVVVEFVGCVKPVGSIKTQSSLDYSFEQSSDDLVYLLDLIQKNTKVYSDEDFGMVSKTDNGSGKGLSFETYIDPYCLGSEARQASHSCTPNCGLLRVISNYLHPYYHRLFYKAMVPIPAGTEIAISYGPAYMKRSGFACKCGTILCKNAPRSTKQLWASLTFDQKVEALTSMVQNWQEIIVADHDSYFGFVKAEPEDTALPCHVMLECEELKTRNEMILDPGKLEAMEPLSDHESDLAVKASYMNRNIEDIQCLESELAAAAARYLKARKLLESPDLLSRRASEGCIEILDVVPAPTPPRRRGRPSKRKFPSLGPSLDDSLSTSTTKSSRSSTESDPPDDPCTPTTTKCLETYFQGRVTLNSRKICE